MSNPTGEIKQRFPKGFLRGGSLPALTLANCAGGRPPCMGRHSQAGTVLTDGACITTPSPSRGFWPVQTRSLTIAMARSLAGNTSTIHFPEIALAYPADGRREALRLPSLPFSGRSQLSVLSRAWHRPTARRRAAGLNPSRLTYRPTSLALRFRLAGEKHLDGSGTGVTFGVSARGKQHFRWVLDAGGVDFSLTHSRRGGLAL